MSSDQFEANPLAQRTLATVRDGIASGQYPVIPQVMELIRAISGKADVLSVSQLADIISGDPSTMARIISIANQLRYNPTGSQIATIQQAIGIVGFERIRNLAISIMLMEDAEKRLSEGDAREIAGLSLASGFMTSELVLSSPGVDPEIAFVCAALRNYGRMLMSTFLSSQYHQARALAVRMDADLAYQTVLGLTPLALGRELLESERLPKVILESMRKVTIEDVQSQTKSPQDELVIAAEFSVRLCEIFDAPDLDKNNFEARAASLARQYGLKMSGKMVLKQLAAVQERCTEVAGHGERREFATPLLGRISALVEGRPLPPPSRWTLRVLGTHLPPTEAETVARSVRSLQDASAQLRQLLETAQLDIGNLFHYLMSVLHEALNLEQSIVFLRDGASATFTARYGEGRFFETLPRELRLQERLRDIFGLCLSRGEDIFIQDPQDAKIRAFIPNWLLSDVGHHPLLLLPIKDDQGIVALILGVSLDQQAFGIVQKLKTELKELRMPLARLGSTMRNAPAPPSSGSTSSTQ